MAGYTVAATTAGIKSCWLVIPPAQTVMVYASSEQAKTFSQSELLQIRLPLAAIFES